VILCFFLRQIVNCARFPIENRDIDRRSRIRLVIHRDPGSIGRPDGICFGDIGGKAQIGDFAAVARDRVEVVNFSAALVRFENDPLSVGRPCRAALAVVRLAELNWPTSCCLHFPQVVAARNIGREDDLLSVGRPGWADDSARVEEIVDRNGASAKLSLRRKRLRIGDFACVRRIRSEDSESDQ